MSDEALLVLCARVRDGQGAEELSRRLAPAAGGSAQLVAAWLPDGGAVAAIARRPRRAAGQDDDTLEVELGGELAQPGLQVFDPRLSTTFAADGTPRRFTLELWLGESEEGEQRPLRVGGEVDREPIEPGAPPVHSAVIYSSGEPGQGLYLQVRDQP